MRFIRVEPIVEDERRTGFSLDPGGYLERLPEIQDELPEGARGFATDAEHYDFFGPRCVKDLKVDRIGLTDQDDAVSLTIEFAPSRFKHDQALSIGYSQVAELRVHASTARAVGDLRPRAHRLGDVQLDEILPHDLGCSHEIQLTGGSLWIVAADLVARWR